MFSGVQQKTRGLQCFQGYRKRPSAGNGLKMSIS